MNTTEAICEIAPIARGRRNGRSLEIHQFRLGINTDRCKPVIHADYEPLAVRQPLSIPKIEVTVGRTNTKDRLAGTGFKDDDRRPRLFRNIVRWLVPEGNGPSLLPSHVPAIRRWPSSIITRESDDFLNLSPTNRLGHGSSIPIEVVHLDIRATRLRSHTESVVVVTPKRTEHPLLPGSNLHPTICTHLPIKNGSGIKGCDRRQVHLVLYNEQDGLAIRRECRLCSPTFTVLDLGGELARFLHLAIDEQEFSSRKIMNSRHVFNQQVFPRPREQPQAIRPAPSLTTIASEQERDRRAPGKNPDAIKMPMRLARHDRRPARPLKSVRLRAPRFDIEEEYAILPVDALARLEDAALKDVRRGLDALDAPAGHGCRRRLGRGRGRSRWRGRRRGGWRWRCHRSRRGHGGRRGGRRWRRRDGPRDRGRGCGRGRHRRGRRDDGRDGIAAARQRQHRQRDDGPANRNREHAGKVARRARGQDG